MFDKNEFKRLRQNERLIPEEILEFMNFHGLSHKELSEILGVTIQAVSLWLSNKRKFSVTNTRLLRLFNKYPQLLKEF